MNLSSTTAFLCARMIFVAMSLSSSTVGYAVELCEDFGLRGVGQPSQVEDERERANLDVPYLGQIHFGREGSVRITKSSDSERLSLDLPDLNVREGDARSWRARSQVVIYTQKPMGRAEGNTLYYFPPEIFRLTPAVTENGAWFSIFELWMGRNWVTPDKSFRITAYLRVLPIISAASSGETESELSVLLVGQQFDAKFNRWLAPSWKFDTQNSLRIRLGDELKLIYSVRRSQSMIDSLGSFAFSSHNQIDPIRGNQVARYELPSISASVQGLIGEADYHVDGLVPAKFYTNREGWMALSSAYRFSMPSIKILNFVAKICN